MAAWDQPVGDARASLQGKNSGEAKPGELRENISAVEASSAAAAHVLVAE